MLNVESNNSLTTLDFGCVFEGGISDTTKIGTINHPLKMLLPLMEGSVYDINEGRPCR